jgi:hypothetical protein
MVASSAVICNIGMMNYDNDDVINDGRGGESAGVPLSSYFLCSACSAQKLLLPLHLGGTESRGIVIKITIVCFHSRRCRFPSALRGLPLIKIANTYENCKVK